MSEFVQVGEYFDRGSAEVICSVLNGHRIPAKIMADDMGGMRPDFAFMGRIRVLVPAHKLEEARALLLDVNTDFTDQMAENEEEFRLNERGQPLYMQDPDIRRAYFSAILGMFILPVISQIYAAVLLQKSLKQWPHLHVKDKQRFIITSVVVVLGIGIGITLFAMALSQMRTV
jgi:hypothetical protein